MYFQFETFELSKGIRIGDFHWKLTKSRIFYEFIQNIRKFQKCICNLHSKCFEFIEFLWMNKHYSFKSAHIKIGLKIWFVYFIWWPFGWEAMKLAFRVADIFASLLLLIRLVSPRNSSMGSMQE